MNNHNGWWISIFQKKITKKSSECHMSNFDEWMKNDVSVWCYSCNHRRVALVEKELLQLNCTRMWLYIQWIAFLIIHAICPTTLIGVKI